MFLQIAWNRHDGGCGDLAGVRVITGLLGVSSGIEYRRRTV